MENFLHDIIAHNLQNRKVAVIENGSWAPTCGKLMTELISKLKNTEIIGSNVMIKSAVKADKTAELNSLAKAIADSM